MRGAPSRLGGGREHGWQPQAAPGWGDTALTHRRVGGAVGQYFRPSPRSMVTLDEHYIQQRGIYSAL